MKKISVLSLSSMLLLSIFAINVQSVQADHAGHPANPIDQNNWKVYWAEIGVGTDPAPDRDGLRIGTPVQYKPGATYQTVVDTAQIPRIRVTYFDGSIYTYFTDELPLGTPHTHTHVNAHFDKHNISTYGWYFHHYFYYGCNYDQWSTTRNGCYKYEIYWSFRNDNQKLSPWITSYGPGFTGVGSPPGPDYGNPIYRHHWRINNSILDQADDGFATYTSTGWVKKTTEFTEGEGSPFTAEGYKWKVFDYPEFSPSETLYVDPYTFDTVTWHDGTTKKATIYALLTKSNENNGDGTGLPGIYCCTDTIATPSPTPTAGSDITIWYVGYMNWDARGCTPTSGCVSGSDLYAKNFP